MGAIDEANVGELVKAIRALAGPEDDDVGTHVMLEQLMDEHGEPFDGVSSPVYVEEKGIRVEAREVDFVASTPDMDVDGDIVEQDFLFERFLKNPVILFAHNSKALPIGKAANVRVEGGALRMTVQFASKRANPLAEQVFLLIKEKVLRAMSIGFIPRDIRREMRDDREVWVLSRNELIESSVVTIPANQNALAELKAKALMAAGRHGDPDKAAKPTNLAPPEQDNTATGGTKEFHMNLEELQKQITELSDSKDAMTKELDALKARYASLEELYKEEKERANKAEATTVERALDELVGRKISANEKPSLLKLASVNRELFEEQLAAIKDRPDMNLREPTVLPEERPQPRDLPQPGQKSGDRFASLVLRRAGLNS